MKKTEVRLKKIKKITIPLIMAGLLMLPVSAFAQSADQQNIQNMDEVMSILAKYHVSGPTSSNLSDAAIKGMIASLHDPYTVYFDKQQFQSFQNGLEEKYVGIGVSVGKDKKGFYLAQIFAGSPAQTAGLQTGDYVVKVDGKSTDKSTPEQFVNAVKGPQGTTVMLTVQRGDTIKEVKVARKAIDLPVVTNKWFDNQIAYIKIDTFSSTAGDKFKQQLDEMKKQGIHALVIDLRDNPGGLLSTSEQIVKQFVKEGTLIHTIDRNNVDSPVTFSGGSTVNFPVYILVNQNSASASEITTGALQDYNVAKAIGTNTFGKGSVQTLFSLSNGSTLKVTIEHDMTPKMRKINKVGIKPDIEVKGYTAQLITALNNAGSPSLSLKIDNHDIVLNKATFDVTVPIERKNQQVFVPSRILAAMVKADIQWDGKNSRIVITKGSKTWTLSPKQSSMTLKDGVSSIDLASFTKEFPSLTWNAGPQNIILQSK